MFEKNNQALELDGDTATTPPDTPTTEQGGPTDDGEHEEGTTGKRDWAAGRVTLMSWIVSTPSLMGLLFIYTLVGGAVFTAIEGPNEHRVKNVIFQHRQRLMKSLLEHTYKVTFAEDWLQFAKRETMEYERHLMNAFKFGIEEAGKDVPPKWTLHGAMEYCMATYTTIGYGHMSPGTTTGRLATILYALVGVPLNLLIMSKLGKLLLRLLEPVWKVINFVFIGSDEPMSVYFPVVIVTGYIAAGAVVYTSLLKHWHHTMLQTIYFIFISTSTVGFGDYLPPRAGAWDRLFWFGYTFFGLALVSMMITMMLNGPSKAEAEPRENLDSTENEN